MQLQPSWDHTSLSLCLVVEPVPVWLTVMFVCLPALLTACLSGCLLSCLSIHLLVCPFLSACLYMARQLAKVGVLVAAGLFWLQAGQTNTVAGVNNLRGLLFFELMFMSMRAMLSALFTFPAEFKMMLKVKGSAFRFCLLPLFGFVF